MFGDANLFTGNCEGASSSNCKGVPRQILWAVRLSLGGRSSVFFCVFCVCYTFSHLSFVFFVASVCFCFSVVAAVSG